MRTTRLDQIFMRSLIILVRLIKVGRFTALFVETQLEDHLVVYCQSGHRSNIAAEPLADLGYRHVYNVAGSMNAWLAAGFPVESGRC